jgi:hypothetical protein
MEEQKRQTVERILNEAGRKQKQRKEKEEQRLKEKTNHKYRKLPDGDIIIKYKTNKEGSQLLFDRRIDTTRYLGIKNNRIIIEKKPPLPCSNTPCGNEYRYKIPKGNLYACSLDCFKILMKDSENNLNSNQIQS